MNFRRLAIAVGILATCGAVFYQSRSAAQAPGNDTQASSKESIEVRYARARLRQAELTLQKAQELNKKMGGTLIGGTVSQFSDDVDFAKYQLQLALHPEADSLRGIIARAELDLRMAETRLKKAVEANQRAPEVVSAADVERSRLGVEVIKLRIERGKSLAGASPDVKLQWQVNVLADELSRVREQTNLLNQNRYPQF
jgi:hypothetical protein